MREMPAMGASTYSSSTVSWNELFDQAQEPGPVKQVAAPNSRLLKARVLQQQTQQNLEELTVNTRRLVQVLIADPNENIPLDQSLLYRGEQKLTDATDQELFFELDVKSLLDKHNEGRIKVIDKKVKERTEYLEPAKIRDLKMVVVTVAQF